MPAPITVTVLRIANLFVSRPERKRSGQQVTQALGMSRSTVYDALERMKERGWLASYKDPVPRFDTGRRHRMYYMTEEGTRECGEILSSILGSST